MANRALNGGVIAPLHHEEIKHYHKRISFLWHYEHKYN